MSEFDFDLTPKPEEDLSDRQERCSKAIRTVVKAIVMRLFVCALLIWIVLRSAVDPWVIGVLLLVTLLNLTGLLPLTAELKNRKAEWNRLLEEENKEKP